MLKRIAKRGPDKVLSRAFYTSASYEGGTMKTVGRVRNVRLWFQDDDATSRYRLKLTREEAVQLRDDISRYLDSEGKDR